MREKYDVENIEEKFDITFGYKVNETAFIFL